MNLDTITSELLFGLRRLRRSPGEIPGIVLTIAVGVGLVAAAWVLVESILLRPLPYPAPEQLIRLWESGPGRSTRTITDAQFRALREATELPARFSVFGGMTAQIDLPGSRGSSWIRGLRVSGEFFEILGARPALGRTLRLSDESLEGAPYIVISERLATRARALGIKEPPVVAARADDDALVDALIRWRAAHPGDGK